MNVLHIVNVLSEGGVSSVLMVLLPALKNLRVNVELLILSKSNTESILTLEKKGVIVHSGKYTSIYDPRNIFLIRSFIKQGNYDIIHTHLFPTQHFVAIAKIITKSTAKYITTEHGSYNKRRDKIMFRPIEKMVYKSYDQIIPCSNDSATNLVKWLKLKKYPKIKTIPNGINFQKFKHVTRYTKRELNLPDNTKVLIMVARFFDAKDHKTVVRSVAFIDKNIHVLFCGSGENGINECRDLARTLAVHEQVHFLGARSDIPELLKSSDIGILSSFNEGFPISLLEYMAAGLPVVCSDVDGSRELAQNCGVLFPVGDYVCLAKEITKLLENEKYYNEIAQKCYDRVQNFSEDKMVKNYQSLYKELLCKTN